MRNATITLSAEVLGQRISFRVFKRSGPALNAVLVELQDDVYRLRHVREPPSGSLRTVVDIGASVGFLAVLLGKLWPDSRVVAVEPAPANFRYLLWNIRENGVAARIWPINVAVGVASAASRTFVYSPTYPTWAQVAEEAVEDDSWRGTYADWQVRFEVEVTTFAELVAAFRLGVVHFLKVDCEGCEWEVFSPHSFPRLQHLVRHATAELHNWALPSQPADLEDEVSGMICAHRRQSKENKLNFLCSTM